MNICFRLKIKSERRKVDRQMSVIYSLKKFLKELGFDRHKGSRTFFKIFRGKYYALAEVHQDTHPCIHNKAEDAVYAVAGVFYDIHIDLWHEALKDGSDLFNFCAGRSLCELSGTSKSRWIATDSCHEGQIVEEIERAFHDFFYDPLFSTEYNISLYDYLCEWDLIHRTEIAYNSPLLQITALDEKRYDEALLCVKSSLLNFSPLAQTFFHHRDDRGNQLFFALQITDEMINKMRADDDERVQSLIEDYDYIVRLKRENAEGTA